MLQVTKLKELHSRELERLVEYCEGLANQHPDAGLLAIEVKTRRYMSAMQLGFTKIRIINDRDRRLVFKIGQSHDTYFSIDQINPN